MAAGSCWVLFGHLGGEPLLEQGVLALQALHLLGELKGLPHPKPINRTHVRCGDDRSNQRWIATGGCEKGGGGIAWILIKGRGNDSQIPLDNCIEVDRIIIPHQK